MYVLRLYLSAWWKYPLANARPTRYSVRNIVSTYLSCPWLNTDDHSIVDKTLHQICPSSMSIMAALPRPSVRPSRPFRSPTDVPSTVLQPNSSNRPLKRKRDHSPRRKLIIVKKQNHVHQARQSLITNHYPPKSILFPSPSQIPVNAVTHSPSPPSVAAPSTLKDNGLNNIDRANRCSAEQRPIQHGDEVEKKMEDKRSLRSHDGGSRSKSELAQYFANYEDLLSLESKEAGESERTDQ